MASIASFDRLPSRITPAVTYSFSSAPVDIAHLGDTSYVVAETNFTDTVRKVRWDGVGVYDDGAIYTGAIGGVAYGITFDGTDIHYYHDPGGIGLQHTKISQTGAAKATGAVGANGRGACFNGLFWVLCGSASSVFRKYLHNGGTTAITRVVTAPIAGRGIAWDGRGYMITSAGASWYNVDHDGNSVHPISERTGFAATGICFNGMYYVAVNG